MRDIAYERAARRALRKRQSVAQRIVVAIEQFADSGAGDVKVVTGEPGVYRLRVGDWRVFFSLPTEHSMVVLDVRPRGGAYQA